MEYGLSFLREVHGFKVSGVSVQVSAKPPAGTANRLNIEHRTSNIERRILMTLHFIDF